MPRVEFREDLGPGFMTGALRNNLGRYDVVVDEHGKPADFSDIGSPERVLRKLDEIQHNNERV